MVVPARPSWDDHETNHIGSPSYHPLIHPDEHFGLLDTDNGFAVNEADSTFNHHNTYDEFANHDKPPGRPHINAFNEAADIDEDYRPLQGTETRLQYCRE